MAERLKQAMKDAGNMRPAELSKRAGVSRATVSLWLNGQTRNMKDTNVARVADVLDISVQWLVHGAPHHRHPASGANQVREERAPFRSPQEQDLLDAFRGVRKDLQPQILAVIKGLAEKA